MSKFQLTFNEMSTLPRTGTVYVLFSDGSAGVFHAEDKVSFCDPVGWLPCDSYGHLIRQTISKIPEWFDVSKTLPSGAKRDVLAYALDTTFVCGAANLGAYQSVTHWQELPALPVPLTIREGAQYVTKNKRTTVRISRSQEFGGVVQYVGTTCGGNRVILYNEKGIPISAPLEFTLDLTTGRP